MLDKECHHDCNQSYCPFAQDVHDANRYVCLKCGVEREIDRNSFSSFLLLILGLIISFMLIANDEKQNESQKQNQSFYYSPSKVYADLQKRNHC
jgi:hypothetical protein